MAGDLVTPVTAAGIRKAVSLTVRGSHAQGTPPSSFSADSASGEFELSLSFWFLRIFLEGAPARAVPSQVDSSL